MVLIKHVVRQYKNMKKNILVKIIWFNVLMFLCFNIFIPTVSADVIDDSMDNLGKLNEQMQLPAGAPLGDIIVRIINIILGFLSLVFVILILWGGFRYMTAGGNAENAKKALAIIRDAVIGVGIVLLSAILVNFVFERIIQAIGG